MFRQHPQSLYLVFTALFFLSTPSFTQEPASAWPSKPVQVVLSVVPGAGVDAETRLYTTKLAQNLGKPFVMDFKPGAGGAVGGSHVAKAAPDGYTLLMASSSFTIAPALSPEVPYDVTRDFAAVSLMTLRPLLFVAHPGFVAGSLPEYIAYAKANPGKVLWATNGLGSAAHLGGIYLHSLINSPATFVHYKGGGQVLADLMGGRVQVYTTTPISSLANIRAGKLKVLAVLSPTRLTQLPDARTTDEQGQKSWHPSSYLGVVTTAGTPAAIVNKLSAELGRIARAPDISESLIADGALMMGNTPGQFGEFIKTEYTRWSQVVRENNIKAE